MGYRSDVAGAITGDKEIIEAIIARLKLTPLEIENYWIDCFTFEAERIKFEIHDLKWYEGYSTVDEFLKWYKGIEEMYNDSEEHDDPKKSLCGKFVRIGEESDDNVEEYFGDDYLDSPSLSRVIDWY
jgi:hypothetical protein